MTVEEVLKSFKKIKSWKKGSERAPHKSLLVLLALGEIQRGNTDFLSFEAIEEKLENLLVDYGPPRQNNRPEYPFVRLANDGIWKLNKPDLVNTSKDYSPSFLKGNDIRAGFDQEIIRAFQTEQKLILEVTNHILEKNFPDSLHEDILQSVGILNIPYQKRKRNPEFRQKVLVAYEYECAICGFSVMLDNKLICLEAAHIKWFEAKGPDSQENGIAMCTLHHKLFDYGAFTISHDGNIIVSDRAHGSGTDNWLKKHHGMKIKKPQRREYCPEHTFLEWHVNEVFKGLGREMGSH